VISLVCQLNLVNQRNIFEQRILKSVLQYNKIIFSLISGRMSEDLAFWTGLQAFSEISILSLVSTLVLALALLLYSFLAVQRRNGSQQQTHHRDMDTGPPAIVQDQQKTLYHMVKFSIRLKRKLKKIRASHSQQSSDFCEKKSDNS
jgi:hypothetical protein